MAKLSKSTRTVIIAAGVLLVLGGVLLALMLTKPSDDTESESSDISSEPDTSITVTDKEVKDVKSLTVKNESGSFTLERNERVVSSTDDEGEVKSETEYFFTSPQMGGLSPNDTMLNAFVSNMAGLSTKSLVEENAEDLEKYGLETPKAEVTAQFEDGTSARLCFGIQNPTSSSMVYFRTGDSRDVHQVSYYTAGSAFYDIKEFVDLVMTEGYDGNAPEELDYLVIKRSDLDEPVEIRYMYDLAQAAEDEDNVITTFNSHRIISPIIAEVDSTKGQTLCYGLYGLVMSSCEYLEKTDEALAATGLDEPFVEISFSYGGKDRVLYLGDKITEVTQTDNTDAPALTTVTGYYAMFDTVEGIYAISKDKAPWYTFTVEDVMSRRPVSPYIYTVDTVEITLPDGTYTFKIEGDADNHTFSCGGEEVDDVKFRELYQYLLASVGEELFFEEQETQPAAVIKFNYREEYHDVYGTSSDEIAFYASDDRNNIVSVNGSTLFKVREIYTQRLADNVKAVITGGAVELNW